MCGFSTERVPRKDDLLDNLTTTELANGKVVVNDLGIRRHIDRM
jgi:hypothetical protein